MNIHISIIGNLISSDNKNMKKISLYFIVIVSLFMTANGFSQNTNDNETLFQFKFKEGDQSRILSTVDENVVMNSNLIHTTRILNRISSKVTNVNEDGSGTTDAIFMTSENAVGTNGKNFLWGQEYTSTFTRQTNGTYTISDIYFMPTVRDVPIFPNEPIKIGETWEAKGHEVHDLRNAFNIQKPFKVPFIANYKYLKDEIDKKTGKTLNVIEVEYNMHFESPEPSNFTLEILNSPQITKGYSSQKIWWDNEKGMIDHYFENFTITIKTFYGDIIEFSGTAHAEVTEFERTDTDENLKKVTESVQKLGYDGIDVKRSEKGLTISIENIQFLPDSSILMQSEKEKLNKIAEILKQFDNDLLITGHCANRGSVKNQQIISENRAISVAEYLSLLKVRNPNCIFTQGKGSKEPIAPNTTEDGRARNRRVEITIMDE